MVIDYYFVASGQFCQFASVCNFFPVCSAFLVYPSWISIWTGCDILTSSLINQLFEIFNTRLFYTFRWFYPFKVIALLQGRW